MNSGFKFLNCLLTCFAVTLINGCSNNSHPKHQIPGYGMYINILSSIPYAYFDPNYCNLRFSNSDTTYCLDEKETLDLLLTFECVLYDDSVKPEYFDIFLNENNYSFYIIMEVSFHYSTTTIRYDDAMPIYYIFKDGRYASLNHFKDTIHYSKNKQFNYKKFEDKVFSYIGYKEYGSK